MLSRQHVFHFSVMSDGKIVTTLDRVYEDCSVQLLLLLLVLQLDKFLFLILWVAY